MRLEWSPNLAVGVIVIDDQHIELFSRFNSLLDVLTEGDGREEVMDVVKFLEDYVVTHFGMEEKVMDRYSYGAASGHRAQHAIFTSDFALLKERLTPSGYNRSAAVELLQKMGDWLLNHVSRTDKALGGFLSVAMTVRRAA